MPLQGSPPISMHQITDQFGAPRGTGLLQMRRGGSYVPANDTTVGIPGGAPVNMFAFLGKPTAPSVSATLRNIDAPAGGSGGMSVSADIYLNNTGSCQAIVAEGAGPYVVDEFTWLLLGAASAFEVLFTLVSGNAPGGSPLNAWHNLGTTRYVHLDQTGPGAKACVVLAQIRPAGGAVMTQSHFSLTANVL